MDWSHQPSPRFVKDCAHLPFDGRTRELERFCRDWRGKRQLSTVRAPKNAVHVVADDFILEWKAVAHVDPRALPAVHVVHEQIDHRIRVAGFSGSLDVERIVDLPSAGVSKSPAPYSRRTDSTRASFRRATTTSRSSDRAPRRRPARRAVLDSRLDAAFGGDLHRAGARGIADPDVAVPVDRAMVAAGATANSNWRPRAGAPAAAATASTSLLSRGRWCIGTFFVPMSNRRRLPALSNSNDLPSVAQVIPPPRHVPEPLRRAPARNE